MENNAKTNDWFASRLLNDDKDPAFLLTEGITPLNSKMETPEFYKNKTKVKERFTRIMEILMRTPSTNFILRYQRSLNT